MDPLQPLKDLKSEFERERTSRNRSAQELKLQAETYDEAALRMSIVIDELADKLVVGFVAPASQCAACGEVKHLPYRRDDMGGYVCLTCVERRLDAAIDVLEKIAALQDGDTRLLEGGCQQLAQTFLNGE